MRKIFQDLRSVVVFIFYNGGSIFGQFLRSHRGTPCKWPKIRVLFLQKSGIASDLAANEFQQVHTEQKSRRKTYVLVSDLVTQQYWIPTLI